MSDLDLKLIGGIFLNAELPPEFLYLRKYFRSDLGRAFVCYYLAFGELISIKHSKFFLDNFIDHTGFRCSEQRLRYLLKRLKCLLEEVQEAKINFDLEKLEKIKSGKYKFVNKIDF